MRKRPDSWPRPATPERREAHERPCGCGGDHCADLAEALDALAAAPAEFVAGSVDEAMAWLRREKAA